MNYLKKSTDPVRLTVSNEITFFGCPEEANPATLYGQVDICHSQLNDLADKTVVIRVHGYAKVFWDEECSYFAIMASRKRLMFEEQELPIHPEFTLPSTDGSNSTALKYFHSFPFEFTIEGHNPSSFGFSNDGINYSVDLVWIQNSFNSDGSPKEEILASRPFQIRRCVLPTLLPSLLSSSSSSSRSSSPELSNREDLNQIVNINRTSWIPNPLHTLSSQPQFEMNEKWVGNFEGIRYCIVAPSCAVLGDQEFAFKVILSHPTNTKPGSVYLTGSLKQSIECQIADASQTAHSRLFHKSQRTTISKTNSNHKVRLICGSDTAVQIHLPLSDQLSEDLDCDLIRISHFIKLTIKLGRFTTKKLELNFPLTVTSIQDLPPPYEA